MDVNTEMQKAMIGYKSGEPTHFIRDSLQTQYKLTRNGPLAEVILPQAFFVRNKKRHYLGDYLTLQYLEDCGLLSKIMTGEVCPHYRIFKSQVFYRHSNLKVKKLECLECANEEAPIVLETNYLDSSNLESHELCLFFERNRLPFKLQYP